MINRNHLLEQIVDSKLVYQGRFIEAYRDTVELSSNQVVTREYLKHAGAACIMAIDSDDCVILEYQYRHPVKKIMFELPAGKLEPGEELLVCAKRELEEETGYIASDWVELGACFPCVGYSTEKITYFLATNLVKSIAKPDEGELLDVVSVPIDDLINMAYNGVIEDSKTLSGLMLYLGYIRKINIKKEGCKCP